MALLIAGLLLWSVIYLMPSIGIDIRQKLVGRLGDRGYATSSATLISASLGLIIYGWHSTISVPLYEPPESLGPVTSLLMLLAIMLFVASNHPTRFKCIIRHPQLTSVVVWSAGHLLQNGDTRSIVLFGWLGIWALLEILVLTGEMACG